VSGRELGPGVIHALGTSDWESLVPLTLVWYRLFK
jgi:hypothetical protein